MRLVVKVGDMDPAYSFITQVYEYFRVVDPALDYLCNYLSDRIDFVTLKRFLK